MLAHGGREAGILVPTLADRQGVATPALASAMLRYLVDPETYRKHQSAAGPVFDAHFEMSATLDNYLSFFDEARR